MKQLLILILSFIFLFLFLPQPTQAQLKNEIMPYPGTRTPSFLGHEHAYTVTLRGNGETHVVLKAAFTNSSEATTSAITLQIPRVTPADLVAYQVIRAPNCVAFKSANSLEQIVIPECEQYEDPNYFEPYYYGNLQYKKATIAQEGEDIEVTLPQGVSPGKSGSIVLFYTNSAYTKKTLFGGYDFTFETLKVDEPIRSLQVGINTDTNLQIKGVSAEVQYRDVFTPAVAMQEMSKGGTSDSVAQYFGQIGSGRLVKTAYELQPNETYTVTATYGRLWWNLYAMEVIIAVLVIVAVGAIVIVLLRKLYGKIQSSIKNESSEEELSKNKQNIVIVTGLSFAASILIAAYSVFQFFIIMLIQRQYYDSTITLFIGLVLFILSICIYALLFVGPGVYIGMKKGILWGIATFVATLCWLFLFISTLLLLVFYLRTMMYDRNIPYPTGASYIESVQKFLPTSVTDEIKN